MSYPGYSSLLHIYLVMYRLVNIDNTLMDSKAVARFFKVVGWWGGMVGASTGDASLRVVWGHVPKENFEIERLFFQHSPRDISSKNQSRSSVK